MLRAQSIKVFAPALESRPRLPHRGNLFPSRDEDDNDDNDYDDNYYDDNDDDEYDNNDNHGMGIRGALKMQFRKKLGIWPNKGG